MADDHGHDVNLLVQKVQRHRNSRHDVARLRRAFLCFTAPVKYPPQEDQQTLLLSRRKPRFLIALGACIVLALQAFAVAGAAGATAPKLDAFGNPLCIAGTVHDGAGSGDDHSSIPNCCALGCSMASSVLAVPPDPGVGLSRPLVFSGILFSRHAGICDHAPDHDPGSPRAPPLTA